MAKCYVYILESICDRKLYIGITDDVAKRLLRHNDGRVTSTRLRRPFELIHVETYQNRKEARQREIYLKSLKSSKYIRNYICARSSNG